MSCCCCCCRKPRTPCGWIVCGLLSFVGSLWFLALGVWAYLFHQSLSPVFTDVKCRLGKMEMKKMSFTGGLSVDLVSKTICENPNPYAVELWSTKGVNVYMGPKRTLVSHIKDIPPTVLPAMGMGSIDVHVKSSPTSAMFGTIFGSLFRSQTPLWIENAIDLKIEINFYFMKVKLGASFNKECGMNVQLLRGAMAKLGAMACADSFDELELPDVSGLAFKGELPLYDYHLAGDEIKAGTLAKDVGLGVAMASGFGLGTLLFFWGFFCVCRFCSGRGARSHDEDRPRRKRERRKEQAPAEKREGRKEKREAAEEKEKKKRRSSRDSSADVEEVTEDKEKKKKKSSRDSSADVEEARKEKREAAKEKEKRKKKSSRDPCADVEEGSQKQEA